MSEPRDAPLLSWSAFVRRMLLFVLAGLCLDALLVLVGAVGFHAVGVPGWLDAAVDAALVITGNGPRSPLDTAAAKAFLGVFAVAGSSAYFVVVALVLTPALHRLLHALQLRAREDADEAAADAEREG